MLVQRLLVMLEILVRFVEECCHPNNPAKTEDMGEDLSRKTWIMRKAPHSTSSEMLLRQRMRKEGWNFISSYGLACKSEGNTYTFTVDFLVFFPKRDVIVEVKGESHDWESRKEKDEWRENLLRKKGYPVVSVTDEEVNNTIEDCIKRIKSVLRRKVYRNEM